MANQWIPKAPLKRRRVKITRLRHVGFEIFTAAAMKNTIFWDVTSCNAVVY
jgi:hypothetical protein